MKWFNKVVAFLVVGRLMAEAASPTGLPGQLPNTQGQSVAGVTSSQNYTLAQNVGAFLPQASQPSYSTPATQIVQDSYDSEGRLVSRNNGQVQIVYDGDGNKVAETVNGVTTTYLVDDNNPTGRPQVLEEQANGQVVRTYTYGHQLISQDQLDPISQTWKASFYGFDGHNSVRLLADENGNVTDLYDYDAFGVPLVISGNTPNSYLFCGEQFDSALNLYYLRARFMNPHTDRFWTMDTYEGDLEDPQSLHKYVYAAADPVNSIDPSGFWIEPEPLDRAELGYQAHLLFFSYCAARTGQFRFYDRPLSEICPDLAGKPQGDLRPDVVFKAGDLAGSYYELKPSRYSLEPRAAGPL